MSRSWSSSVSDAGECFVKSSMGESSKIEWTDHTFNPWWGCEKVSPACDRCYAESTSNRYGHYVWGKDAPRRFFSDKHWNEPLKWNAKAEKNGNPKLVFCASMADVFENHRNLDKHRKRLWWLIRETPHLRWLLLTKRPENIMEMIPLPWRRDPEPNVWYGVTAENERRLDERMAHLIQVPATTRWVSYEPALGAINISLWAHWIDWIIVGGESGAGARPMELSWAKSLLAQCRKHGIPYFMKQLGGFPDKRKAIEAFPTDLRVRDFPQ